MESMDTGGIFQLPAEILSMVFQHLSISDLLNTRLVCRKFKVVASDKRVLKIRFKRHINLENLIALLDFKSLAGNVRRLSLTRSYGAAKQCRLCSLTSHFIPIRVNCCNLTELCLYDLTIDEEMNVDVLPPSLRHLTFNKVTFDCDSKFFYSRRNDQTSNLERLEIETTRITCFSLILCFGSSLKALILKDVENFSRLHFSVLKWRFPQLETFVLNTESDVDRDALTVVRTFPNLKHLQLKDAGDRRWQIEGLRELWGFDCLETLTLHNVVMSRAVEGEEGDGAPVLPRLRRATICFLSVENRFFYRIAHMFPNLQFLTIDGNWNINNGLFPSVLACLGTHPTLRCLHLENCLILHCRIQNEPSVVQRSSRTISLVFGGCSIGYEAIPFIVAAFPSVEELSLEYIDFRARTTGECVLTMLQGMSHLKLVKFKGTFVTDGFLETVVPALSKNLEHLELCSNNADESAFGNNSMKTIGKNVSGLKTLTIVSNKISFDGIFQLSRLKNLGELRLNTETVTSEQLENMKRFLPSIKLFH